MTKETAIVLFKEKTIRRTWNNEEWWFSVADVCAVLVDSVDGNAYWRKLKQRLNNESDQPVTFCHGLKLISKDGKSRITDCANTEGIFRLIQSIPSPKAEKPKGIVENKKVAKRGGSVAGKARKETEKELGKSVVTSENYLQLSADKKTVWKNKKL